MSKLSENRRRQLEALGVKVVAASPPPMPPPPEPPPPTIPEATPMVVEVSTTKLEQILEAHLSRLQIPAPVVNAAPPTVTVQRAPVVVVKEMKMRNIEFSRDRVSAVDIQVITELV